MTSNNDLIRFFNYSDAWAFFRALKPTMGRLDGRHDQHPGILFRGVGLEHHPLVPSVFREDKSLIFNGRWTPIEKLETNRDQLSAELETFATFFEVADRKGLPLPEDSQSLRQSLRTKRSCLSQPHSVQPSVTWPPPELWSAMAVAQHNGIATRLLDWTWDPRVASYFAAAEAANLLNANKANGSDRLAVWAIDPTGFSEDTSELPSGLGTIPQLVRVTAPLASNPNLRAQRGAFLLLHQNVLLDRPVERMPYTHAVSETLVQKARAADRHVFVKFTLPISEASDLLMLLRLGGTDAGTLFSGFDGVVRSLRDRALHPSSEAWMESGSRVRAAEEDDQAISAADAGYEYQ